MMKPHGSDTLNPLYVADHAQRAELVKEAGALPNIIISSGAAASAVMLASGYFNPLDGYMDIAEAMSVAEQNDRSDVARMMAEALALYEQGRPARAFFNENPD